MSYETHNTIIQGIFAAAGINSVKVTHAARIFAAQIMYEMGVPLEVRLNIFEPPLIKACRVLAGAMLRKRM